MEALNKLEGESWSRGFGGESDDNDVWFVISTWLHKRGSVCSNNLWMLSGAAGSWPDGFVGLTSGWIENIDVGRPMSNCATRHMLSVGSILAN